MGRPFAFIADKNTLLPLMNFTEEARAIFIVLAERGMGRRNRTFVCGFGDRRSATELHPHITRDLFGAESGI